MNKRIPILLLIIVLACGLAYGQDRQQTIHGRVTDRDTQYPLPGAAILLIGTDPPIGTVTDNDGYFELKDVTVGRVSLQISYLGYKTEVYQNLVLTSGKQLVVNVTLEEMVIQGQEVVIQGERSKQQALNEMATVSARQFTVEETNRYAGTLGDPARMAANFAGVGSASDQRNDIIIRGNSPVGVLWRFEGVDIPSPNHFVSQGTNGGPISILNNNLLANSDFFTGAFPAEYGNAQAGVFDLTMRRGNTDKREYTFQVGFNGAELMTEGPFSRKKGKASYLASYRYSTLDIFEALGINFGTAGIPRYQDFSMKAVLPAGKGEFTVFAIGGISQIELKNSEKDSTDNSFGLRNNRDATFGTRMGAGGISHTYHWNDKTFQCIILGLSGSKRLATVDSISPLDKSATMVYEDRSAQWKSSIHYYLSKKFSQRHQVRIGWIGSQPGLDFDEVTLDSGSYRPLRSFQGRTYLSQTYVQWKYRITDVMVITPGLHWQHLTLNNNSSIEPRIGFRWQMNEKHTLSAGYGMHSQLQMYDIYFYETPVGPDKTVLTNKNLGFSKSHQWVVGHNFAFSRKLRLRTEIYLQKLYNIPVRNDGSGSFSVLNLGSEFNGLPDVDSLANNGKGTNYGLEITLERFFNKGFYYLGTLSLFRSEYVAADDIKRSSAYDGRYVINLLVGKEFNLGKHKVLSVDARLTRSGGKPYTPLDLQASLNAGGAVFDDSKAYTERFPDYFRTDLNLSFRINAKKVTHEWAFDVQNILNSKNILLLNYDSSTNQAFYEYQLGFFPVFQYRMMF